MRRRIEIWTLERERVVSRTARAGCPVFLARDALLTTKQAAVLLQVSEQSIRRWLVGARIHGVKPPGGRHRVCRQSLLRV